MQWQAWVLIVWYAVAALLTVTLIGKPREPITHGVAVASLIACAIQFYLVLSLTGQL